MKKFLSIVGMLSLSSVSLLAVEETEIGKQLSGQANSAMTTVFLILKIAGFGIAIWGVADLMQEEQGQGGGGKYMKAVLKLIVGGVFIASGTIYAKI